MAISSLSDLPVSGLFDGGVAFYIPRYQRPFAWTKDQWGELFSDIGENDQGYFLGSIICINKHHDAHDIQRLEVVDGQQRLITLSLLFASMYDFLQSRKDSLNEDQRADIVNLKRRLMVTKPRTTDSSSRLIPQLQGHNQQDYYTLLSEKIGIYKQHNLPPASYRGNRRIYKAYDFFNRALASMEETDDLPAVIDFLAKVNATLLVKIEVAGAAEAHMLFESLNNRGIPLTAIDLIKNDLLSKTDESQQDERFNDWSDLIACLGDENAVAHDRFFRHYYNAFAKDLEKITGSRAAEKGNLIGLYERLFNKRDLESRLQHLLAMGREYQILTPGGVERYEESRSETISDDFKQSLFNLEKIQGAPSYLLMLYLLARRESLGISEGHLTEVVERLVCFFVRRNLTNTPPTSILTKIFMEVIDQLDKAAVTGDDVVEVIHGKLSDWSADDSAFRKKLESDIYEENKPVAFFLLRYLEESSSTTRETRRNLWDKGWSVEHVFPKGDNIPDHWVEMIAGGDRDKAREIQESHVHRLGNLTLTRYNSSLGTMSFEDKRDKKDKQGNHIGFKNGLWLNEDLAEADRWTKEGIDDRTERLVKVALEKFRL